MTKATLILLVAAASVTATSSQQKIYQRPTSVTATITGSPTLRDGSFTGKGTSGICGEIPKMASMTGEDTFVIEFTGVEAPGSVYNISFGSQQLVRGTVTGNKFVLNVSVVTANGGKPPLYALDTQTPRAGETGTANLTQKGPATTLSLTGVNDAHERLTLTVTCG